MPSKHVVSRGIGGQLAHRAALSSTPALEFGDGDEDRLRAAADDAELRLDVLVEEVATHAKHLRGLAWADRQTRQSTRLAIGFRPLATAVVGSKELKGELSGVTRHRGRPCNLSGTGASVNTGVGFIAVTSAQIIREARLKAELTQTELAQRIGRDRAQVARWETGGQDPSFENLRSVVEACGFVLKLEIAERERVTLLDTELDRSLLQAPQQRLQTLLDGLSDGTTKRTPFEPYGLFEPLERHRVGYVVIGGLARVIHGSGELTRGLDIVPSLRENNLRHLAGALEDLNATRAALAAFQSPELAEGEPLMVGTSAGRVRVVPSPWGTRGYDDFRIRSNRENLGQGLRPKIAATVDLVRMLEASTRPRDLERLQRLRRLMELERVRTRRRGLSIER
jgi:transcriptional regulator with XRE-family HTH domain